MASRPCASASGKVRPRSSSAENRTRTAFVRTPVTPFRDQGGNMRKQGISVRRVLLAALVAGAGAAFLAASSVGSDESNRQRPLPPGFTEGYGNEKVVTFKYPQQWYCNDELGDDLDGPGHRGDGIPVEQDPDEHQHPAMGPPGSPCIVGDTGSGSLPRMDPTGRPVANSEPVW